MGEDKQDIHVAAGIDVDTLMVYTMNCFAMVRLSLPVMESTIFISSPNDDATGGGFVEIRAQSVIKKNERSEKSRENPR
jgi:hypothetical protein